MKNRYDSEATIQDILDVATQLFLEKGYDKTSIADIVNGLDGLTRGAIYHHFESKEAIVTAVTERLFLNQTFFDDLASRDDLSGQEKLKHVLLSTLMDDNVNKNAVTGYALLKNPKFYVEYLKFNAEVMSPRIESIIIEGNEDGSLDVQYPRYIAEAMVLLLTGWYVSAVYPVTPEEFIEKLKATRYLFQGIGLEVFSENLLKELAISDQSL